MLLKTKYAALCVLGTEIFYVLCLGYGSLLSGKAKDLHHALFELMPGFIWGNLLSILWGALYLAIFAWIAGWYIAWMYNASIMTSTANKLQ